MKTVLRLTLLVVMLALLAYGQRVLDAHLAAAMSPSPVAPPLDLLPRTLGPWCGEDETIAAEARSATTGLRRTYFHAGTGQAATVYLTYVAAGGAPVHHPEVVAAVAELGDDPSIPPAYELAPNTTPVQQYRRTKGTTGSWIFHWYYALPTPHDPRLDVVQQTYRRLHAAPPYVVAEIFVPENFPTDPDAARELVRFVDAAVQPLVGPAALRGSRRIPFVAVAQP